MSVAPGAAAHPGAAPPPLLDPAFVARLEALQVATRRRLAGQFAADHRSTRHGSSLDFADQRDYHPGDDFRRIDYHLLARLDVLMVKLFEAEDDITLRLLVDTSASMAGTKLTQAARLAAALGFVALVHRDVVTVHRFLLDRAAPRFVGRNAAPALFAHLQSLQAHGATPFAAATSHLLARRGPPGMTIVLSDLLTPEWDAAIGRLPARGDDVVVVHVTGDDDLDPALSGDLDLVDRETGERVAVSVTPEIRRQHRRVVEAWYDEVALRCRRADAAYLRIPDTTDIEHLLLTAWRREGVLR